MTKNILALVSNLKLSNKQSGFTLVEIIIVIAIMGIIGGLASMIIGRSLDSYAALERREKLQTSVRLAVERMSRELRHALPHSICVHDGTNCTSGTGNRFYFVPVKDSGRYQDRPGAYPAPMSGLRNRIRKYPLTNLTFDILSSDANLDPTINNHINAKKDDWVSVYNLDNSQIYTLPPNQIRNQIETVTLATNINEVDNIKFYAGNNYYSDHSPTRRFHIIDNNKQVTLFSFNNLTKTLTRDTTTFTAPNTSVNSRLLMQNVSACTFTYTPGSLSRAGLLHIDITISLQGEQIRVIHDAHVYNTP